MVRIRRDLGDSSSLVGDGIGLATEDGEALPRGDTADDDALIRLGSKRLLTREVQTR